MARITVAAAREKSVPNEKSRCAVPLPLIPLPAKTLKARGKLIGCCPAALLILLTLTYRLSVALVFWFKLTRRKNRLIRFIPTKFAAATSYSTTVFHHWYGR
jgi:hypothetical protein